jgi:hypothetical protein
MRRPVRATDCAVALPCSPGSETLNCRAEGRKKSSVRRTLAPVLEQRRSAIVDLPEAPYPSMATTVTAPFPPRHNFKARTATSSSRSLGKPCSPGARPVSSCRPGARIAAQACSACDVRGADIFAFYRSNHSAIKAAPLVLRWSDPVRGPGPPRRRVSSDLRSCAIYSFAIKAYDWETGE